ncbi:MAG: cadmium-translocating P-type ATPase [Desulfovibrio sp.]|nr:cadmium-translocating P-type ATPase [Desulfovibrio sp.]
MELSFILKGLSCPNCAAKIEHAIGEVPGVSSSSLNFLQQRLQIRVDACQNAEEYTAHVKKIVQAYEPDVIVLAQEGFDKSLSFMLKGLTCPNCASKIADEVSKLANVGEANLNLLKQRLSLRTSAEIDEISSQIKSIVRKFEPDVLVSLERNASDFQDREEGSRLFSTVRLGGLLFVVLFVLHSLSLLSEIQSFALFACAYLLLGYRVLRRALINSLHGNIFDENFLMSVSTIGAFCIGEYPEGCAVMLFYQIGEFFQDRAVRQSKRSIASLLDIRPEEARVLRDGQLREVEAKEVAVGEEIVVRPGERIPLDGVIVEGDSALDTRALTGESLPRNVSVNDRALSGCINMQGLLRIRVTAAFGDTQVAKILDLVENAASKKSPTENFITHFARWYTPLVVFLALLLAVVPPLAGYGPWIEWVRRAFVFLIVSCPCALVVSIPLTFFGGIGASSRQGILVKGGNYLEALSKLHTLVFDKTGTLSQGIFAVSRIIPARGVDANTLLHLAALTESASMHPIARSIVDAGKEAGCELAGLESAQEFAGRGMRGLYKGQTILVGNDGFLQEQGIDFTVSDLPGTKIYVALDGQYLGLLIIEDTLRPDSAKTIERLRQAGIADFVMLTGDEKSIAADVAAKVGINHYQAELLPDQKVACVEKLFKNVPSGQKLAFVGDGINDAPVLMRADIGIAMGAMGSDAAIEAADVVLMTDELSKLKTALNIAKKTMAIVWQNIVLTLLIKFLFLGLGACGLIGLWAAVFGDVGVTLLAVANALRILRQS